MILEKIAHPEFYISKLTPDDCAGYLLNIHGGPGFHSAYFERALQEVDAFTKSRIGWICYDQRSCGRSKQSNSSITHDTNIEDLLAVIRFIQESTEIHLIGMMGHSYGGWLAYHTLIREAAPVLPLVIVATAKDMRTARNHSIMLDMAELRMDQPEKYQDFLSEFGSDDQPLWTFQKRIREDAMPLKRRSLFMWGNLKTKHWYEALKQDVDIPENWKLTREISNSVSLEYATMEINPSKLSGGLLWICGMHDLLMGFDQYYPGVESPVTAFLRSGHYPHLEEPERFVRQLNKFLRK